MWNIKLKQFLHDPVDKCFGIQGHVERARRYANVIGVSSIEEIKDQDHIASCMERSFLPKEKIYQDFTEIRHPLSEGKLDVTEFNKEEIFKKIEEVFVETNIAYLDDKQKFFYLWRNLPLLIYEKFKDSEIGRYIPLLPADTRIPDHSIWEHLKITSVINAFEKFQNNSLFLFSIGPVQSFIAQARKTQDLFMGSFIISYLTFKGIEVIIEKYGPTNVIYPDLYGQPLMDYLFKVKNIDIKNSSYEFVDQPTILNRFVVILPFSDKKEIENLAKEIENAVRSEWNSAVNTVLSRFKLTNSIVQYVDKQNKNFPEIYWVAIPLRKDDNDVNIKDFSYFFKKYEIEKWEKIWHFVNEKGEHPPNIGLLYQLAYSALEKSMGARKNLRNFEQTEEHGKKCHLCGEREAIINARKENLKVGKYISSTEGLCILCFTKRAFDKYLEDKFGYKFKEFSFPSSAEIACSDFKERALEKAKEEFIDYIEKTKRMFGESIEEFKTLPLPKLKKGFVDVLNIEGSWFFEENIRIEEIEEQIGEKLTEENINELKESLKKITDKTGKPNPYYSVIMLDADFMGKWLSGEKLPAIENAYNSETWEKLPDDFKKELSYKLAKKILTPAIHSTISHALRNYSIEFVRKIIEEEHLGKLIYAGGDDMLAFVNLKDLLEVMRKLRAAFSGHIRIENDEVVVDWSNGTGFVEKESRFLLTMGPKASASAGIVIAHYKTPLKLVIDKVRQMEKKAKEFDEAEKNSFGLALMKHSGDVKEFCCKWKKDGIDMIEYIKKLSEYFRETNNPRLSKTFPYKLYQSLSRLKNRNGNFTLSEGIFDSELKRNLTRFIEAENKEQRKEALNELTEILNSLFWHSGIGSNIDKFTNLIEIARFITLKEGR